MNWECAALSDRGRRRPANEDSFLIRPDLGVLAVADGMGGHVAGEVASGIAISTLAEWVEREHSRRYGSTRTAGLLVDATHAANAAILARAEQEPDKSGMGTTLTALALVARDRSAVVAHVGDSRAYLLRDGALHQLTRDHTWVQQQVDAGTLTLHQARVHAFASVLTQALGTDRDVDVEVVHQEIRDDDRLLLCSDGLSGMLEDDEILAILLDAREPDAAAAALIAAANERGGADNITALVTWITPAAELPGPDAPQAPPEATPQSP